MNSIQLTDTSDEAFDTYGDRLTVWDGDRRVGRIERLSIGGLRYRYWVNGTAFDTAADAAAAL